MSLSFDDAQVALTTDVGSFIYRMLDFGSMPEFMRRLIPGSMSKPLGSPTPIYLRNPNIQGRFLIVGYTKPPFEFAELPVTERMHISEVGYLEDLQRQNCPVVIVSKIDKCGSPASLENWNSAWIFEAVWLQNFDTTDLMMYDDDQAIDTSGSFTVIRAGRTYPLGWSEQAGAVVLAEVLRVRWCGEPRCANCGQFSDGTRTAMALTRANTGSPGLSAQLIHTDDNWSTETAYDIDTLGGVDANDFDCEDQYVIVVSAATGSLHYAKKSALGTWTEVSTGFVTGPRAIHIDNIRNILIAGAGGYIYRATDFKSQVTVVNDNSATTENQNKIHGAGATIVSVGDNNTVLVSNNNGENFTLVTGPNAGNNLLSVYVFDRYHWYVGDNEGKLWYTHDGGANWYQRPLPDQANVQAIWGMDFSPDTPQLGALALEKIGGGEVYRTITGGREWYEANSAAIIGSLPAMERCRSVACRGYYDIMAAGKDNGSTDGIIAVASKENSLP